jgi:GTP:adenosylcobinamide-phosphate guanylyltransferase
MDFTAVIAIGGEGKRLSDSSGILSRVPKAFRRVAGAPAVFWTLQNLRRAGITNIVLCGSRGLSYARDLAVDLGFSSVRVVRDPGLGFHGLPLFAIDANDQGLLLIPGHCAVETSDYLRLMSAAGEGKMVVLWHDTDMENPQSRTWFPLREDGRSVAVSAPYAFDRRYLAVVRDSNFSIDATLKRYAATEDLVMVKSFSPVEFDVLTEMVATQLRLRLRQVGSLALSGSRES